MRAARGAGISFGLDVLAAIGTRQSAMGFVIPEAESSSDRLSGIQREEQRSFRAKSSADLRWVPGLARSMRSMTTS